MNDYSIGTIDAVDLDDGEVFYSDVSSWRRDSEQSTYRSSVR